MIDIIQKPKVVIVPCSGIGKTYGTVSREAAYIITEEFSNGVGMIESIAADNISVIICSEKFPWKCHRKWIARELQHRGWEITHIIDKGKVWKPK